MRRNILTVILSIYLISSSTLLTACADSYSKEVIGGKENESVLYESNTIRTGEIDKEIIAQNTLESRLEKSISQMVTIESVSVKLSKGEATIYIKTGKEGKISDEEELNIRELVGRSIADISDEEIILDISV